MDLLSSTLREKSCFLSHNLVLIQIAIGILHVIRDQHPGQNCLRNKGHLLALITEKSRDRQCLVWKCCHQGSGSTFLQFSSALHWWTYRPRSRAGSHGMIANFTLAVPAFISACYTEQKEKIWVAAFSENVFRVPAQVLCSPLKQS